MTIRPQAGRHAHLLPRTAGLWLHPARQHSTLAYVSPIQQERNWLAAQRTIRNCFPVLVKARFSVQVVRHKMSSLADQQSLRLTVVCGSRLANLTAPLGNCSALCSTSHILIEDSRMAKSLAQLNIRATTRVSPFVNQFQALMNRCAIRQGILNLEATDTVRGALNSGKGCGLEKLQPVILQPALDCGP